MDEQGARTEFWTSPTYQFSRMVYPTDEKRKFAKISEGIDSKDQMFLFKLKDITLPLESHRLIFDGKAYCQIRNDITKLEPGKTEEGVVKGSYCRIVRIDIMSSKSKIPRVLRETLEEADYEIAEPHNNRTIEWAGLLGKL